MARGKDEAFDGAFQTKKSSNDRTVVNSIKQKYCADLSNLKTQGCVIVFHGRPKKTTENELGYLTNVVLSNLGITRSGISGSNLSDMCPNVVDLDLSGNYLDDWQDIFLVITQLKALKFLNLARNRLQDNKGCLSQWSEKLPAVENLVLNNTQLSWSDILALAKLFSSLKELHVCQNGIEELPDSNLEGLHSLQCLRLNDNNIQRWREIWKINQLRNLRTLILSGNPLADIFYLTPEEDETFCHVCLSPTFSDDSTEDNDNEFEAECSSTETSKLSYAPLDKAKSEADEVSKDIEPQDTAECPSTETSKLSDAPLHKPTSVTDEVSKDIESQETAEYPSAETSKLSDAPLDKPASEAVEVSKNIEPQETAECPSTETSKLSYAPLDKATSEADEVSKDIEPQDTAECSSTETSKLSDVPLDKPASEADDETEPKVMFSKPTTTTTEINCTPNALNKPSSTLSADSAIQPLNTMESKSYKIKSNSSGSMQEHWESKQSIDSPFTLPVSAKLESSIDKPISHMLTDTCGILDTKDKNEYKNIAQSCDNNKKEILDEGKKDSLNPAYILKKPNRSKVDAKCKEDDPQDSIGCSYWLPTHREVGHLGKNDDTDINVAAGFDITDVAVLGTSDCSKEGGTTKSRDNQLSTTDLADKKIVDDNQQEVDQTRRFETKDKIFVSYEHEKECLESEIQSISAVCVDKIDERKKCDCENDYTKLDTTDVECQDDDNEECHGSNKQIDWKTMIKATGRTSPKILESTETSYRGRIDSESSDTQVRKTPSERTTVESSEAAETMRKRRTTSGSSGISLCRQCSNSLSGEVQKPFETLDTLCVSDTKLSQWEHLTSLNQFPALKAVRVKGVELASDLPPEDRRKLFMASLPKIKHLNGGRVDETEREKAERHLLRHFWDKEEKPDIYPVLEKKHGTLAPLVDIDIGRGFKEEVTLTFCVRGQNRCWQEKVSTKKSSRTLKNMLVKREGNESLSQKYMIHRYTGPYHEPMPDGSIYEEELFMGNGPISRFDVMEGDEIIFM